MAFACKRILRIASMLTKFWTILTVENGMIHEQTANIDPRRAYECSQISSKSAHKFEACLKAKEALCKRIQRIASMLT